MLFHGLKQTLLVIFLFAGFISCVYSESVKTVVVYGDSRTNYAVHRKLLGLIESFSPEAVFHTGDLVQDARNNVQWKKFVSMSESLLKTSKFYPTLGNHEHSSKLYFDFFKLPNNERWYAVDTAGIHAIVMDTYSDYMPQSEQYAWLEKELEDGQKIKKLMIIISHTPPYSTGPHGGEKNMQQHLVPLFEKFGVKAVFSGHDHDYERSEKNGITYIVTGGGGAPLYNQKSKSDISLKFVKKHHFCVISERNGVFHVVALDDNKQEIDAFDL